MQTVTLPVFRFQNEKLSEMEDILAIEEPLQISVLYQSGGHTSETKVSITMRTPGEDAALATGFLYTEGILTERPQIEAIRQLSENEVQIVLSPQTKIDFTGFNRNFYTTSSCGVCGKTSVNSIHTLKSGYFSSTEFRVSKEIVTGLNEIVRKQQSVFESTGGLHASALFTPEGILSGLSEDVGRHNALDKMIGKKFLEEKLPLNQYLLFLSGRASFELIQKAAMAEIPVVCALGAPSSLAVELARSINMTLLGFVKPHSFNLYSGAERLI